MEKPYPLESFLGDYLSECPVGSQGDIPNDRLPQLQGRQVVPTGIPSLDNKIQGLGPGELILIAGRPSMGKTVLAMNLCERIASQEQQPVLIFSMVSAADTLAKQLLFSAGGVDNRAFSSQQVGDTEKARLCSAFRNIGANRVYVDDTPILTGEQIRLRAGGVAHNTDASLACIFIDYFQLLDAPGVEIPQQRAQVIARELKTLARELGCPIVVLSQLTRDIEQRDNKRPMLNDIPHWDVLKDSVDACWMLYRDEVYNPETQSKAVAEVTLCRPGEEGITIPLQFSETLLRFRSLNTH